MRSGAASATSCDMMKKFFLLIALLLPLAASAARPSRTVSKTEIAAIVSEFRRYDGVEVVKLNRLATGAVKGVVRLAANSDPDAREALRMMKGLKKLTVLNYDDAAPEVKARLNARLAKALDGSELLMEAKDGDSALQIFGIVDDANGLVRDFVLHAPKDCALICAFGSMSLDSLSKLMAE